MLLQWREWLPKHRACTQGRPDPRSLTCLQACACFHSAFLCTAAQKEVPLCSVGFLPGQCVSRIAAWERGRGSCDCVNCYSSVKAGDEYSVFLGTRKDVWVRYCAHDVHPQPTILIGQTDFASDDGSKTCTTCLTRDGTGEKNACVCTRCHKPAQDCGLRLWTLNQKGIFLLSSFWIMILGCVCVCVAFPLQ